ncbi:MAG: hypothetical protein FGM58_05705 [Acidimicrobiia bacterium]|nr:hypothetical protein [Acidimicrobiia bacterium]
MTTVEPKPRERSGEGRPRRILGIALAVLLSISTFATATLLWTDHYVFDAKRFAARADSILDSPAVRAALADEITSTVIATGSSEVASFRAVIRPTVELLIGTPVFRRIFRNGLVELHNYLFTKDGNAAVVNLSQAFGILTASLQVSNSSVASLLPESTDTFLVNLGNTIQGLELWRVSSDVADFGWLGLGLTALLAVATVAIDRDRRRGTFRLGIAVVVAGALVFVAALVAEIVAGSYGSTPVLEQAISGAASAFLSDYRTGGLWLVGLGAAVAAFATASAPTAAPTTARGLAESLQRRARRFTPTTTPTRVVAALAMMAAGGAVLAWTEVFFELVAVAVAATLLYLGAARLLAVIGRVGVTPPVPAGEVARERTWHPRLASMALGTLVVLAVLVIGGMWATADARARATGDDQRTCNGFAELCDRRLDEVAFAGAHNAMSVSTDPGWLFFEQGRSIPAQLDSGIRALLVKTHYGIPTTIRFTGTDLVITDKSAELYVDASAAETELTPAQQIALDRSTEAARNVDPNLRDIYLCHVNCEFGATRFATVLGYVRQFVNRNPDEVVILFVGNYVADVDTDKVFREARLLDRLWRYDPSAPLPTLAELIDSGRNIIYLGEFTRTVNPDRPWDVPGYGIFQDNPYTYTSAAELLTPGAPGYTGDATVDGPVPDTVVPATGGPPVFSADWTGLPSCRPNRGTPESPLFQINHWVTPAGAPPTVAQARIVNSYSVLAPAVRNCMIQRRAFPTIVGVNFAETGELFRVVNELNGVG